MKPADRRKIEEHIIDLESMPSEWTDYTCHMVADIDKKLGKAYAKTFEFDTNWGSSFANEDDLHSRPLYELAELRAMLLAFFLATGGKL